MKKLVFEFEIDNLQPEDEIEASDVYGLMYQRFPLSLVSVRAVEHSVQADGAYCVCPQSLIPVVGNAPTECPYCHQPRR